MNFLKELKESQNLVLEFETGFHKAGVLDVNRIISKKFKSICYITTTKPASALFEEFKKEKINVKEYHFIDCVSKRAGLKDSEEQIIFISSPTALTPLAIEISKKLKEDSIDLLVLDSISSLLVYNKELSVVKFLHFLMTLIKGTKTKAIYLIMKEDLRRKIVREIELFADAITWME